MAIYAEPRKLKYIIGFLNSKLCQLYLSLLNESLNYNQGDIAKLPIIFENVDLVVAKVVTSIDIVKKDWDSFETSWDFQHHPLLRNVPTIAEAFIQWQAECADRFNQLKANEEALNRIFIDIYGLQDELTPEVEDKDVTVRKADLGRDIRSFISYAVGWMWMGLLMQVANGVPASMLLLRLIRITLSRFVTMNTLRMILSVCSWSL